VGGQNTHATPTPIIEEGRIYVHFGSYGTACLDTETGETIWENRELKCDHRVRPASSPIIDGDSLFLTFDGVDVQFVAWLDKNSGETNWITPRDGSRDLKDTLRAQGLTDEQVEATSKLKPNDNRKSYATPTVIEYQGKKQLISPGAEITYSYDPENGEENWRVQHEGYGWNVASRPVFAHDLVYITMGISSRLAAIRPDGSGDVTDTHMEWIVGGRAPQIPSPTVIGDLLFMVSDRGGSVTCMDAKTGEQIWRERLPGGGTFWGSPVYADGKLYVANTKGTVHVFAPDREFKLIAENIFEFSGKKKAAPVSKEALAKPASKKVPEKDFSETDLANGGLEKLMKSKGMSSTEIETYLAGARGKDMSDMDIAKSLSGGGEKGASAKGKGGAAAGAKPGSVHDVSFTASPAIAGSNIILRSETHLYCIAQL
jgi:outer membrane protein assembly factor BamB